MRDDRRTTVAAVPMFARPVEAVGGAGPRSATLVIASSASMESSRDGADFIVEVGTDAGVILREALAQLAADSPWGGSIYFTEGRFEFFSVSAFPAVPVTLFGAGASATEWVFSPEKPSTMCNLTDAPSATFRDLRIVAAATPNDTTTTSSSLIVSWGGVGSITVERCVLDATDRSHGTTYAVLASASSSAPMRKVRVANSEIRNCRLLAQFVVSAHFVYLRIHDTEIAAKPGSDTPQTAMISGVDATGASICIVQNRTVMTGCRWIVGPKDAEAWIRVSGSLSSNVAGNYFAHVFEYGRDHSADVVVFVDSVRSRVCDNTIVVFGDAHGDLRAYASDVNGAPVSIAAGMRVNWKAQLNMINDNDFRFASNDGTAMGIKLDYPNPNGYENMVEDNLQ